MRFSFVLRTKGRTQNVEKLGVAVSFCIWRQHCRNKTPGNAIPVLSMKLQLGWYVFWLFFKIDLCSAISFKRSRRELSIDVAEHKSMSKNKGVVRILVIFQDKPMFSHIIRKVSARAFH